jgi:hypothetical protein
MNSLLLRIATPLLFALPLGASANAPDCFSEPSAEAMPVREALFAPPALGFVVRPAALLPVAHDEHLALDRVLQRQRLEGCLAAVLAPPAEAPASAVIVSADGYVPKTEFDNTPHRFDMEQNGKRMTADDFEAWMNARGYRVSKGKPAQASETVTQ